ncbi:MAG: twin-arginine translocase TatA/TatE family subunit [Bryobacteraceae bacterium]
MIENLLRPQHLLMILAVALFIFGPKKLPELGKGLAEGIKSFKDGIKQGTAETPNPTPPSEAEKPNV